MCKLSVIIPFKGEINVIKKLLSSIPESKEIQVIVADNNLHHFKMSDFKDFRQITLIPVEPQRGAGGARNEGLKEAVGEWVIFADADDYFVDGAFDVFLNHINNPSDIIFFKAEGEFVTNGARSDRADYYAGLIEKYTNAISVETELRYRVDVPWGKMIRFSMIKEHSICFDEIVAGNDAYFSLLCGFYANKISTVNKVLYKVTVSEGSLTQRKDYAVVNARLFSRLHCNEFYRKHGLNNYQHSIMYFFLQSSRFGLKETFQAFKMIIKFRQNPFVGFKHWLASTNRIFNKS